MSMLVPTLLMSQGLYEDQTKTMDLKGFVNSKALQSDCAVSVGATYNLYCVRSDLLPNDPDQST